VTRMGIRLGVVLITAYALALGILVGVVMERFRFDRDRAAVLREYEEKTARVRRWLMQLETDTARGDALPAASRSSNKTEPTLSASDSGSTPREAKSPIVSVAGRDW
jgi:hypothetical protein